MDWFLQALEQAASQAAIQLYLTAAILCGSGIAYFVFQMPSVSILAARIDALCPRKSKQFRARLEVLALLACGLATVHFVVAPTEARTAFLSGFSWYSLLTAAKGVGAPS
jgi:hypothetical protein